MMHKMRKIIAIATSMLILCGAVLPHTISIGIHPFISGARAEQSESILAENLQEMPLTPGAESKTESVTDHKVEEPTREEERNEDEKPFVSVTPIESEQPRPMVTAEPVVTDEPVVTAEPMETDEPPAIEQPVETDGPAETIEPCETEEPNEPDELPEMEVLPETLPEEELLGEEPEEEYIDSEEAMEPSDVKLGAYVRASAVSGEQVTIAIPVEYTRGEVQYFSNQGAQGGIRPYHSGHTTNDYDQTITEALAGVRITVEGGQAANFPISPGVLSQERILLSQEGNMGYAVFEDVQVLESAEPGVYPLRLRVAWRDVGGEPQTKTLTAFFEVTAPEQIEEMEPLEPESIMLGEKALLSVGEGERDFFAIPIQYAYGDSVYASNVDEEGVIIPYGGEDTQANYHQAITDALSEVRIAIAGVQEASFPLLPNCLSQERPVIFAGKNRGYAVFEGVQVLEGTAPGIYPLQLHITWQAADGEPQITTLSASIEVTAPDDEPLQESVTLGDYTVPSGAAGEPVILALPINYAREDLVYASNASEKGGTLLYDGEDTVGNFSQTITEMLSKLEIAIADEQEENFPFELKNLPDRQTIVSEGQNLGYAAFEDLLILEGTQPGIYPVKLDVSWQNAEGETHAETLVADLEVKAAYLVYVDGVIVYDFNQLQQAVQSGLYDKVYLGYNEENKGTIKYTSLGGIEMSDQLSRLEIVGTDPIQNERMTLEDIKSDSYLDTLRTKVAGQTLVLKNVNVTGLNWYGILYGSGLLASHLVFDDVDYFGRAMSNNFGPGSSVTFINCRCRLTNATNDYPHEAVETHRVYFYGYNTFKRVTNPANLFSVFYLYDNALFHVMPGAVVDVDTNLYAIFTDYANSTAIIEGTLNIKTNGNIGCFTYATQYFTNLTIAKGGALNLEHNGDTYGSLRAQNLTVRGTLTVNRSGHNFPCVAIPHNGSAKFESPELVSLSNPNRILMRGADAGSASLTIATQAVNLWAGGQKRIWNNNNLNGFGISASMPITGATTSVSATGLADNKGVAHNAIVLNTANFNLGNATKLVFGNSALTIDDVYTGDKVVKGNASNGTILSIEEYPYGGGTLGANIQTVSGIVAAGGRYRTAEGSWNPVQYQSRVYAKGVYNDLEAHVYKDAQEACFLYEVPPTLDFGTVGYSGHEQLVNRLQSGWTVRVLDSRLFGSWKLFASAEPLSTEDGSDTLPTALVFIPPGGTMQSLSSGSAVLIATKPMDAEPGITNLSWAQEEGPLIYLQPMEGTPDASYSATITWTLEVGP